MHPYNFGASGNILMKLFQATWRKAGVVTCVQFSEGTPPKIWEAKKRPNFGSISDNFRLWSRIFPERVDISNIRKVVHQLQPLPRWTRNLVNFGPHTKKLQRCILVHPSGHFWGHNMLALKRCCVLKFLHALEIAQGFLAHSPTGTGTPPKKNNCKHLNFGLKFSVWAPIS